LRGAAMGFSRGPFGVGNDLVTGWVRLTIQAVLYHDREDGSKLTWMTDCRGGVLKRVRNAPITQLTPESRCDRLDQGG
jgi:hypothetical protein